MITCSLLILLYFLPTILAARSGHQITGILLLNLFFGWTVVVWFALLLWAVLSAPRYVLVAPAQSAIYPYYQRRY
jgi:hypothetical protein